MSKRDKDFEAIIKRSQKNEVNPVEMIDNLFLWYLKAIGFVVLDTFNHTCLHFMDTVKVRQMAKSQVSDVSHYFKNNVKDKPIISGITAGFFGGLTGSLAFIYTYTYLTHKIYFEKAYLHDWDFRYKNLAIYFGSEISSAFGRIFFEAWK